MGGHPQTLDTPNAVWLHKWLLGYTACPHSIHQLPCGYAGCPLVTMVAHSSMQHLPAQEQGPAHGSLVTQLAHTRYTNCHVVTQVAPWLQWLPTPRCNICLLKNRALQGTTGPRCVCLAMWNCPLMSNLMRCDAVRGQLLVVTMWDHHTLDAPHALWLHRVPYGGCTRCPLSTHVATK